MRLVARTLALVAFATAALVINGLATIASAAVPASTGAVAEHHDIGIRGIGIRLLDAAVDRRDDPRARLYIDDHLRPGTSITRHVQVSDHTHKPVQLHMFAVASTIDDSGWEVADDGTSNELTSWMDVTPSVVHLQPGRSATVTVHIDVPPSASRSERYAT